MATTKSPTKRAEDAAAAHESDVESYSDDGNASGVEDDEDAAGALQAIAAKEEEEEALSPEEKAARDALLLEEEEAFRKQKETQLKSLQALREAEEEADAEAQKNIRPTDKRLQFLMAQSDVFTSFLMGGTSAVGKAMTKKRGETKKQEGENRRSGKKADDSAEDQALLAMEESRFTRLDKQPSNIAFGTMKPYQLEGLNWMIRLHDCGVNGILADEMGLGKTLQSISLLAYLREARAIKGPHMIIVPKSTVGNWMRELNRWCPSIRAFKFMGDKEQRNVLRETMKTTKFDACVLSYEVAIIEKATLKRYKWKYMLIDEAHRIKNENSKLSTVVREFDVEHRLLITGTPLQNNLHELWALLNFLLPGQENVIKKLHTVLRPFLLRRLKSDVEHSLPPKIETKLYVGLSEMQREWYTRVLHRDATHLNSIGGSDRVRLLNILMQLRKVTNHPYLFDGAEPGPPYKEGPHLWENCGKMTLLHKLLPRLKAQGSRVLIFCQMTSMLNILEDYMRYNDHEYCRLDGSTQGELRDEYMDVFNAPNSTKFVFLLSTRAGGLGINLATADIVILFDSDWNPQVDLQAMDRAHRIGQTKLVRVFRFVTDGTVEEKIIERAERKLYLDAAIIQQGRLAQQNRKLSKDELMTMVRFGADEIFNAKGSMITDDDIDAILAKGEERTEAMKAKVVDDMQHNLANFSLTSVSSLYDFEGENFAKDAAESGSVLPSTFIALPARERKKNYDVDEYYRQQTGQTKPKKTKKPDEENKPKVPRMTALLQKRYDVEFARKEHMKLIKEAKADEQKQKLEGDDLKSKQLEAELENMVMDAADVAELEALEADGFGDWSRRDLKQFVASCERFGRSDKDAVCLDVATLLVKDVARVAEYYDVFWARGTELEEYQKYMDRIERGEKRIQRNLAIKEALASKVARYKNPWRDMKLTYPGGYKSKGFTMDEDVFLICMMHKHGVGGDWVAIKEDIRKAWQFRFDWFFKSRTILELQKRGEFLTKLIEKENEELGTKVVAEEEHLATKAKPSSSSSGSSSKKRASSSTSSSSKRKRTS
ncbi:hypothetical protein SPRG_11643 [Saprolegnia parasitica CBS 223.65]|uniref:Uncharacterized protein n=1 Tax=Saprolegnia parasitica (strain CBS 223.65) TaxID=695850 RepID=A0A067BXS8_SAPPC|nr:hypothetical protein SPRG_11643 [Saprolegnia parasitica CBS 223.65]KDO23329.1 hypothetical protein SPRG_11643 [Saprolegnia parasitica CBS 223.65]|eukprot:XP_012205981.1 hypothetical protein SPRG_11643 [Saprolegnia parasitica CBS 223.65]